MPRPAALVVAAGPEVGDLLALVDVADLVIAVDGGLDHLSGVGVRPDLLVGDLDSVSREALTGAETTGVVIERHPADKDETDLELGMVAAVNAGARSIVVTGLGGGRLDHELAGLRILGSNRRASSTVTARLRDTSLTVIRDERVLTGRPGSLLTLLAIGGPAEGVTTTGLQYPLTDERLDAGSGRGLSNLFELPEASISVRSGVLFAIVPVAD